MLQVFGFIPVLKLEWAKNLILKQPSKCSLVTALTGTILPPLCVYIWDIVICHHGCDDITGQDRGNSVEPLVDEGHFV